MSDLASNAQDALRRRVEAQHGPIHQQDVPTDPAELAELATHDPDRFNCLFEAGRIDLSSTGKGADDGEE